MLASLVLSGFPEYDFMMMRATKKIINGLLAYWQMVVSSREEKVGFEI